MSGNLINPVANRFGIPGLKSRVLLTLVLLAVCRITACLN
jgi:hypothetical protein